jgi:hypothetical protein
LVPATPPFSHHCTKPNKILLFSPYTECEDAISLQKLNLASYVEREGLIPEK